MQGSGAMGQHRLAMHGRAVARMPLQSIAGVLARQALDQAIAGLLGENAGRRNLLVLGIATHHATLLSRPEA